MAFLGAPLCAICGGTLGSKLACAVGLCRGRQIRDLVENALRGRSVERGSSDLLDGGFACSFSRDATACCSRLTVIDGLSSRGAARMTLVSVQSEHSDLRLTLASLVPIADPLFNLFRSSLLRSSTRVFLLCAPHSPHARSLRRMSTRAAYTSSESWLQGRVGEVPATSLGWFRAGVGFYNKREFQFAIECLQKSVQMDPLNVRDRRHIVVLRMRTSPTQAD